MARRRRTRQRRRTRRRTRGGESEISARRNDLRYSIGKFMDEGVTDEFDTWEIYYGVGDNFEVLCVFETSTQTMHVFLSRASGSQDSWIRSNTPIEIDNLRDFIWQEFSNKGQRWLKLVYPQISDFFSIVYRAN